MKQAQNALEIESRGAVTRHVEIGDSGSPEINGESLQPTRNRKRWVRRSTGNEIILTAELIDALGEGTT